MVQGNFNIIAYFIFGLIYLLFVVFFSPSFCLIHPLLLLYSDRKFSVIFIIVNGDWCIELLE